MTTLALDNPDFLRTLRKARRGKATLRVRLQYSFQDKKDESVFNEQFVREHLADQLIQLYGLVGSAKFGPVVKAINRSLLVVDVLVERHNYLEFSQAMALSSECQGKVLRARVVRCQR